MAVSVRNELQSRVAIQEVASQYETVLTLNFEKQEKALVQQLYDHAKELKRELAIFRREVSQENIERLIADRRREKEKERQLLESRWRECNEGYKALQEEQKRLVNQHRENLFDVKNLEAKIKDFQAQLDQLKLRVTGLESESSPKFMTETQDVQPVEKSSKPAKAIKEARKLTFPCRLRNDQNSPPAQTYPYGQSKTSKSKPLLHSINFTQYSHPHNMLSTKHKSSASALTISKLKTANTDSNREGANELQKFMDSPRIRQKIFQFLQRQI